LQNGAQSISLRQTGIGATRIEDRIKEPDKKQDKSGCRQGNSLCESKA